MSPAFQCGFTLAHARLRAPGSALAKPSAACRTWLTEHELTWAVEPGRADALAATAFGEVITTGSDESDLAIALFALLLEASLEQRLVLDAAALGSNDPELLRAYLSAADQNNGMALHGTLYTLHGCIERRTQKPEFAAWRALCSERLGAVKARVYKDPALVRALDTSRDALRLTAAGERPPGPAVCWAPCLGNGPRDANAEAQREQGKPSTCARETPAVPAAPWAAAPSLSEEFAGPWPRDHRYGPRFSESNARVSMTIDDQPDLDLRPLASHDAHKAIARCFASDKSAAEADTLVIEAELSVDPTGQVKKVKMQSSDKLASPTLLRCIRDALQPTTFPCTRSGRAVRAHATFCIRHE